MRSDVGWKFVLWIDLAGGGAVVGLLCAFVWLGFLRDDPARRERTVLRQNIGTSRSEITSLSRSLEQQRKLVGERREELARTGKLPDRPPIEQDLQTLAMLAGNNGLKVLRVVPLPSRSYPGLLEIRYTFEAEGRMSDLAGFLKAIEAAACWADIGYLVVDGSRQAQRSEDGSTGGLSATLIISLFSSASDDDTG